MPTVRPMIILTLLAAPAVAIAATMQTTVQHHGTMTIDTNGQIISHDGGPMVEGSGRIVSQSRPVSSFRQVELSGVGDAEIRLGAAPGLTIIADDNIQPYLTSKVEGGTLKIGTRGSFRTRAGPRIRITTPDLGMLLATGSGDIAISNVANRQLRLKLQGSGDLKATGRTSDLDLVMQGSGDSDLRGLHASRTKVSLFGSGDAVVRAAQEFDGRAFGSGSIRFIGKPQSINVETSGSGRVDGVDE